jgi:Serine dehydrogenase proteinase
VVGSGNRDHYRNDSCGLVEINVRAIRLGKGYLMSALGHSRPMRSVPVPINVRC